MKKLSLLFALLIAVCMIATLASCSDASSDGEEDQGEVETEYYREVATTDMTVKVEEVDGNVVRTITNSAMTEITTFVMDGDTIVSAKQERIYVDTDEAKRVHEMMEASFTDADKELLGMERNGNVFTCNLLQADYNVYNVLGGKAPLMEFLSSQYADFGYTVVE